MHDRGEPAVAVGAQGHPLAAPRPEPDGGVHLRAGQRQLDRSAQHPGGVCGQELVWPRLAGVAERAADERGDDPDVVGRDTERLGVVVARVVDALHFVPHGELVAVPGRDGGRDLHRVVVVARDAVGALDGHRRVGQRGVGVAA